LQHICKCWLWILTVLISSRQGTNTHHYHPLFCAVCVSLLRHPSLKNCSVYTGLLSVPPPPYMTMYVPCYLIRWDDKKKGKIEISQ
jgi:hypothetical protein